MKFGESPSIVVGRWCGSPTRTQLDARRSFLCVAASARAHMLNRRRHRRRRRRRFQSACAWRQRGRRRSRARARAHTRKCGARLPLHFCNYAISRRNSSSLLARVRDDNERQSTDRVMETRATRAAKTNRRTSGAPILIVFVSVAVVAVSWRVRTMAMDDDAEIS